MSILKNKSQQHLLAVLLILIAAIAFGGGGSKYGLANLAVQITALGVLLFHRRAFAAFWSSAPMALRALFALTILLPVFYLIPLPPELWTELPGREMVSQSLELAGEVGWRPASVDPIRTLLALTALIAPLSLVTIGWRLRRDQLVTIGWVAVSLGVLNVLIGIPQVLSDGDFGLLYPETPMPGVLFGTFANRNSTGVFLAGTLALAALLPIPKKLAHMAILVRSLVCVLLLVAIVLTRSRTATVLAFLPLVVVALRMGVRQFSGSTIHTNKDPRRKFIVFGGVFIMLAAITALAVTAPGRFSDLTERFESRTDARAYIWEDSAYAASRYWPIGSGTGTFDDVFQVDESLENITQRRAGRAHNDYLEVAVETGIAGTALIIAWMFLLAATSWKARTSRERWIAWSGSLILGTIALQSITDYPLRNQSLLVFASFGLLMLMRFADTSRTDPA